MTAMPVLTAMPVMTVMPVPTHCDTLPDFFPPNTQCQILHSRDSAAS